ncbi:MAG: urate hydroxylase PuuD [Piscirickettsiaceae bacterium]|nr:urate hydroxylase PuuD [Piscirickettsiaceae bacterium]
MELEIIINILARWGHLLFGITWIGILYYFNFIQGGYFKLASAEGLADAKAKLAPSALWWFRWAAMFTFVTGIILIIGLQKAGELNPFIIIGIAMGTLMFLNVWFIIWPNQKVALGLVKGNIPVAGSRALLASRTNTLFSGPMIFSMLAGPHFSQSGAGYGSAASGISLWVTLAIIAIIEINGVVGRQGPMTTVCGVIISSVVLTAILVGLLIMPL